MLRLKSRLEHPPHGFQVLIPEIGMEKPFIGSFDACSAFFLGVVQKNPHLAKQRGWQATRAYCDNWVETREVERLEKHGWTQFLTVTGEDAARIQDAYTQKKTSEWEDRAALAGGNSFASHIRKTTAGIGLVLDWLGEGLTPVSQEEADKRAWICAVREDGKGCPKNSASIAHREAKAKEGKSPETNWLVRAGAHVAQAVRTLSGVMNDLTLRTSLDSKLGGCVACDCDLRTKMWPSLNHILNHTKPEVMADLDPGCWIKKES